MKHGYLARYFKGIAVKSLSAVEADRLKSNQHEYNGDRGLKNLFGNQQSKLLLPTTFLYLDDEVLVRSEGTMTWYDARYQHETRTEWRLYFPTNEVSQMAVVGDTLFICRKLDDTVLSVITKCESTIGCQLKWLFNFDVTESSRFSLNDDFSGGIDRIEWVARMILEQIGIATEEYFEGQYLDEVLARFEGKFPSTKDFSRFARATVQNIDVLNDPDQALLSWIEREEELFRMLEKHLIAERLRAGFVTRSDVDVDGFIAFSLSVQNRRKSRVGHALENHIEELFNQHHVLYSRTPVTENKSKPDFILPCIEAYRDVTYPAAYLSMLGAKSSCKDRWRQVLAEADKIEHKHLLTLEAAISESQTREMAAKKLRLVLPKAIHKTYTNRQRTWLYSVEQFIEEVKEKQNFFK